MLLVVIKPVKTHARFHLNKVLLEVFLKMTVSNINEITHHKNKNENKIP